MLVIFIIEFRNLPKASTGGTIQKRPFSPNEGEHLPGISMDELGRGRRRDG